LKNCWITLGAYGDICNTLPLVWHDFQSGNRPTMLVAERFKDILDGVSYCERAVHPGHYSECLAAAASAEASGHFDNIYVVQCYGSKIERFTDSFTKESWRLVGKLDLWDKLPLVFDLRHKNREAEFIFDIQDHLNGFEAILENRPDGRPKVIVATSGKSSPFPHRDQLVEVIMPLQHKYEFINLDNFRAHRFYDIIGLMEQAVCLIATDSGPLHLAYSVPQLPVIALVTNTPDLWHGSPRRSNYIAYIRYNEFVSRRHEIPGLLANLQNSTTVGSLIHVWSDYTRTNAGAVRRHSMARKTWEQEYLTGKWKPCCVHETEFSRNGNEVGEQKPVPFVRDLLMEAVTRAGENDVIVFSNDDTCFACNLTQTIIENVQRHGAIWGSRREHRRIDRILNYQQMIQGYKHCGADIFAFSKKWWELHNHKFPDFLLSFEAWDLVLKKLIQITGGTEVQETCYHEVHESFWHEPANRECPGNLYNRELTRGWLAGNNISWNDAFK